MAELASALRCFGIPEGVPSPPRLLPALTTSRDADVTPLQVTEVEPTARLSETLQLSGMTTGTLPELPAFWSLPRMAAAVFLSALLISMATARSLRTHARPHAAGPPSSAVPFSPPPVTLTPEPPAPSLPIPSSTPPEPVPNVITPPGKSTPRPVRARGSPGLSHPSQVESAFGHRK